MRKWIFIERTLIAIAGIGGLFGVATFFDAHQQTIQTQEALVVATDPSVNFDTEIEDNILKITISNASLGDLNRLQLNEELLVFPSSVTNTFAVCEPLYSHSVSIDLLKMDMSTTTSIDISDDIQGINKIKSQAYGGHMQEAIRLTFNYDRAVDNKSYGQVFEYYPFDSNTLIDFHKFVGLIYFYYARTVLRAVDEYNDDLPSGGPCPTYEPQTDKYILMTLPTK